MQKEMSNTKENKRDYYGIIRKHLNRQYSALEKSEINSLTREVIFAPNDYVSEVNETPIPITNIRENLADSISDSKVPSYSLEADIADLIEKNNCETSSYNEYYRWLQETADILKHTTDNNITTEDLSERSEFLNMSNDRETEILLCLSLYESANNPQKKEKVSILKFKLQRLREMRSIVRNTPKTLTPVYEQDRQRFKAEYDYCLKLLQEKSDLNSNFNDILKININHISNEDLAENYSYLNNLQSEILHQLHLAEKSTAENQRSEKSEERNSDNTLNQSLSSVRETEGR